MDPQSYSSHDRPLNVTDALTYLDAVKSQFQDQPDVYNHFLDIMKEFKNEQIDTPGVIKRVSHLFNGHPALIQGFNTFLPVGYRIECSLDAYDAGVITVTTPSGTTLQTTNHGPGRAMSWSTAPSVPVPAPRHDPSYAGNPEHNLPPTAASSPVPGPRTYGVDGQAIEPAVQYVQKIKQRCDTETYRQFLDILSRYYHEPDTIDEEEVSRQIARLFKDAPDLRQDFRVFMPDRSQQLMDDTIAGSSSHRDKDRDRDRSERDREREKRRGAGKLDVVASAMSHSNRDRAEREREKEPSTAGLPLKRKRKPVEKEREQTPVTKAVAPPAKKVKHASSTNLNANATAAQDLTPLSYNSKHPAAPSYQPSSSSHHALVPHPQSYQQPYPHPHQLQPARAAPTHPDTHFFDRVKRALDNRDLYNEFLKLVNLFAQDYIDTARLVKESRNFLGETELYDRFREILGWDERREGFEGGYSAERGGAGFGYGGEVGGWAKVGVVNVRRAVVEEGQRPGKVDFAEKYGSYRRVSASQSTLTCSGRDDMCRSVLNDEWVSHPTWTAEDSGFVSHRKNVYEEALHRSEEERHEYDFHIDAVGRTIGVMEPVASKIASGGWKESAVTPQQQQQPDGAVQGSQTGQAGPLKKSSGPAPANPLIALWKPIHTRVLKKIYGREAGLSVIACLQSPSPSSFTLAVPVVLARLKQKEEEWKRAQREWNKVWRDVDRRNYEKSLDWRGVGWKVEEKKRVGVRYLVTQVEVAREERRARGAVAGGAGGFGRRGAKWDLAFAFGDLQPPVVDDPLQGGESKSQGKEKQKEEEEDDEPKSTLTDLVKLTFSFLDRTQNQLGQLERKRIENFLRAFVPVFFAVGAVEFNEGLVCQDVSAAVASAALTSGADGQIGSVPQSDMEGAASDGGEDTIASASTVSVSAPVPPVKGRGRQSKHGHASHLSGGDLRKKLLKSEQAKSTATASGRKTRGGGAGGSAGSPAVSRFASPVVFDEPGGVSGGGGGQEMMFVFPGWLGSGFGAGKGGPAKRSGKIHNVFFTNTTFYALLRLIELLYSRLKLFKSVSADLAVKAAEKAANAKSKSSTNGSATMMDKKHHYETLLGQCEALFTNELEQNVFEDQVRGVFGYKDSYKIFTVDKVIGAIIKQVQLVIADPKSQELLELLKRERSLTAPTTQDRVNYRHQVENIMGPDENVFRIDWLSEPKTMTIQLLGRDDATFDDSEALTGRWQSYIDAYVSGDTTDGLPRGPAKRPYLRRNLPASARDTPPDVSSQDGLEIKVCLRTYRLFYVSKTEDLMWKYRSKEEADRCAMQLKARNALRRKWLLEGGVDQLGLMGSSEEGMDSSS